MHGHRRFQTALVAVLLCCMLPGAQASGSTAAPLRQDIPAEPAQALAPEYVGLGDVDQLAIGGGSVYWGYAGLHGPNAAGDETGESGEAAAPDAPDTHGALQRLPLGGGRSVTLRDSAFSQPMAADETGVYYYNAAFGGIVRRTPASPLTETLVVPTAPPSGRVALGAGFIYFLVNGAVYFADKEGQPTLGEAQAMANSGTNPTDLVIGTDNYLYWFGDNALYRIYSYCLFGHRSCIRDVMAGERGSALLYHEVNGFFGSSYTLHWIGAGGVLRNYGCHTNAPPGPILTCGAGTTFDEMTPGALVRRLVGWGDSIFWHEWYPGSPSEIRRYTFGFGGSGDAETIAGGQGQPYTVQLSDISAGAGYIYFGATPDATPRLARVRHDAPPILPDLEASAWEVTQGVQRLANDSTMADGYAGQTALVADKTTYVRLFGTKLSGPRANNVRATLEGSRGGQPLPGSPLAPLNGARLFADGRTYDRGNSNDGWLFALPPSWTTGGAVQLRATVNAYKLGGEPNSANNLLSHVYSFGEKAPICIVFIPVRTNHPLPQTGTDNWVHAVDMTLRLLPTHEIRTYRQGEPVEELEARFGIPPWEYGPYEMDETDFIVSDSSKVIISLFMRDQFSDDPDDCDDLRARTHYVGMVSPQSVGNNGTGRLGGDQLWFRLPPDDRVYNPYAPNEWRVTRSPTLAHELGHNYDRRHVDCGNPDDTGSYPYNPCDMGPAGGQFYYGFNVFTELSIDPLSAGDLMSYSHTISPPKPRWTSDYTWNGIANEIPIRGAASAAATTDAAADPARAAAQAEIAAAGDLTMVTGRIGPDNGGSLEYAWVYPGAGMSAELRAKWQRTAAPSTDAQAAALDQTLHVRLVGPDGTVRADRTVTPEEQTDATGATPFFLTFPAPAGQVTRVELLRGSTLLAVLAAGGAAPTVQVLAPTAGQTVDGDMTLRWRASDPDAGDKLLFSMQYSPDGGQTWRAVLTSFGTNMPGSEYSLPLRRLGWLPGGTTNARIRVLASDGYHTAAALSAPFTVPDRKPEPLISAPGDHTGYPAGAAITLRGFAMDAEDGSIPDSGLAWRLNGAPAGAGKQMTLVGLASGEYTVELAATDSAGQTATASRAFTIAPLAVPLGAAPALDGSCEDDAYGAATRVSLKPAADGSQGTAFLLRSDAYLWVCFADLLRTQGSSPGTLAVVRVDPDASGDDTLTPAERIFYTGEDGVPWSVTGEFQPGPGGLNVQVSADSVRWNAELRIDAAVIGGWNKVVRLTAEQDWLYAQGDVYPWPHTALWNSPRTWSLAVLGDLPAATELRPATAVAESAGQPLEVKGSGFSTDTAIYWNGTALATTFIDAETLRAGLGAAELGAAGAAWVSVANPATAAARSAPLPFVVTQPKPHITSVRLNGSQVTVDGAQFVAGATLLWDGRSFPATVSGSSRLQATLDAAALASGPSVDVVVANPGPGGGASNVAVYVLPTAPGQGPPLYLPVIRR